jgi:hypothetical protein
MPLGGAPGRMTILVALIEGETDPLTTAPRTSVPAVVDCGCGQLARETGRGPL